jgi:hypothetical protein
MQPIGAQPIQVALAHPCENKFARIPEQIARVTKVAALAIRDAVMWIYHLPARAIASLIVISIWAPQRMIAPSYAVIGNYIRVMNADSHSPLRYEQKTFSPKAGVECDGIEITYKKTSTRQSDKTIVYFLPNGALWPGVFEQLDWMSLAFKANVVCYNYRATGYGKGQLLGEQDLVEDGVKIVQSIKDQRIFMHGWSLGGGVAMQVAARLKDQRIEVPVANERSFSSLQQLLRAHLGFFGIVPGWILKLSGWQLNSAEVLPNLKSHVIVMSAPDDSLMKGCSLDAIAKQHPASNIHRIVMDRSHVRHEYTHCRDWYDSELERYKTEVNQVF